MLNGESANFKFDSSLQYWKGVQPDKYIAKKRGRLDKMFEEKLKIRRFHLGFNLIEIFYLN